MPHELPKRPLTHQNWLQDQVRTDPSDPRGKTLWVTGFDAFKSADGGKTWVNTTNVYGANPQRIHPDQRAIAAAPDIVYLGNDGGVWTTADQGSTWTERNDTLAITQFMSVAAGGTAGTVAGGTVDNGTLASTGATLAGWRSVYTGDGGDAQIDFSAPQTLDAETQYGQDLVKSIDGGFHWNSIVSGITGTGASTACFRAPLHTDDQNRQHLPFGTNRVFESTDGGTTWTAQTPDLTAGKGCIAARAMAPSNARVWYAGTSAPGSTVWTTQDGGITWSNLSAGIPQSGPTALVVSPANTQVVYATFGTCWALGTWLVPGCTMSPSSVSPLWRTSDGGAHWQDLSANFPTVSASSVIVDPRDPRA